MELQWYFSMFFSFATEMIISMLLVIPKRANFRKMPVLRILASLVLIYGVSVGLFFLSLRAISWSVGWNIGLYTIFIVTIFFGFYNVYAYKAKETLLMILIAYTFQHILYQSNVLVLQTGLAEYFYTIFQGESSWIASLLNGLIQALLYIGVWILLYLIVARNYAKVCHYTFNSKSVILLAASVYLVIVVANVFVSNYTTMSWFTPLKIALAFTFMFICSLFQLYVIWGFRWAEMATDMKLLEQNLTAKLDQYEKNEQNIAFINMKCHDLRKIVRSLKERKGSLTDDDFALLEESLRLYDTGIRTGDHNIDTLIQEKQLYCRAHNIEFTALIDGAAFSEMDFSDVYFLFLNIIDNAIEAAEQIEDESLRIISLTAKPVKGVILIESVNYFQGERRLSKDGKLLSTKEDPEHHGYGTQSIELIVSKYKGTFSFDITDNVFTLKIAI